MKLSLRPAELTAYLARQVSGLFPDREVEPAEYRPFVDAALERTEHCFAGIGSKYFPGGDDAYFNHRHTDQYAMFLYFVSNCVARQHGELELAEKAYALNKALHALDVFYEIELPAVFGFQHPVGTVLGRANYSNYFFVYQRCSTGAKDAVYPTIGEGVVMYGGSSIIGSCNIGDNVMLSAGALVMGQDIPGNSVVFGQSPHLTIKPTQRDVFTTFFHAAGR